MVDARLFDNEGSPAVEVPLDGTVYDLTSGKVRIARSVELACAIQAGDRIRAAHRARKMGYMRDSTNSMLQYHRSLAG